MTKTQTKFGLLILAYVAFISLGLPDGLLGVAWPSMRASFSLPLDALGTLLIVSTAGYLTSSFFSGRSIAVLGVGGLLAVSCAATGASLLGYTLAPAWWLVVALGVMVGLGAGAIDAGLNTYIAAHFSEDRMQWLHASFGVGITLGPLIMTAGLNWFDTWRAGYVVVGVAQLLLALGFGLSLSLWKDERSAAEVEQDRRLTDYRTSLRATLRQPGAWLSILLFFIYTGIELTLGHWAYTLLTEARGVAPGVAGVWVGSYWATFTVGRILAGLYTRRIRLHTLLRLSMLGALAGTLLLWWNPGPIFSLLGVALVGFSIAPIFPGLVSGTSERVPAQHAANTIGMQISAAGLGVAVLPSVAGIVAKSFSLEIIPIYLSALVLLLIVIYNLSIRGKVA